MKVLRMSFVFPSIKSLDFDDDFTSRVSVPPVTKEDIAWTKSVKKKCNFAYEYRAEAAEQIAKGNLRRFVWLTQILECNNNDKFLAPIGIKFGRSVLAGNDFSFKSSFAVDILREYPELKTPQRNILTYLVMEGRKTQKDYSETSVINAAIRMMGQGNSFLKELSTSIQDVSTAISAGNIPAFGHLIAKHYTQKSGMRKQELQDVFAEFYWFAAQNGNVKILNRLHEILPMPEAYQKSLKAAISYNQQEAIEWFLEKEVDKDEAFRFALSNGKYDVAEMLIEQHKVDPNAQDCAALKAGLNRMSVKDIEFLISHGADTKLLINHVAKTKADDRGHFDVSLASLFSKAAMVEQVINWEKEDHTTVFREHRTANFSHQMLFFFGEEQVTQSVTNIDKNAIVSQKTWSFNAFDNQDLLKEAAQQLKNAGGDPECHKKAQPAAKKLTPNSAARIKTPHRS